jgi:uncharacterized protein YndB with AHSA1/START domain
VRPIAPIRIRIRARAVPERAWAAITEPERVAAWFTAASPVGAVGDRYRLDFGGGSIVEGAITALIPGRSFSYAWAWVEGDGGPRSTGPRTQVTWVVRPLASGGAEVELLHEGWTTSGTGAQARDDHQAYWAGYLEDLRAYLDGVGAG